MSNTDFSVLKSLSLLVVDDEPQILELINKKVRGWLKQVYLAADGEQGFELFLRHHPDLVVTDIRMPQKNGLELGAAIKSQSPETPVIIFTAFSEVDSLIRAIDIGVDGFVKKPMQGDALLKTIWKCARPLLQNRKIISLDQELQGSLETIFGKSQQMQAVISQLSKVAASDFSVILLGETGVGKSLLAQTLHNLSPRRNKPFVTVDIGAMPETLVESELFGYCRGAFTGAEKDKPGFFEFARQGTIFIDELENLSPGIQAKLLRAVEDKKIFALGSTSARAVDVRIISASNRDIVQEVAAKRFREDLYYRLAEFNLKIPPLRERKDDIVFLAQKFVLEAADELQKKVYALANDAQSLLCEQPWPGNIRQLKNSIRRAVLFCEHGVIEAHDLAVAMSTQVPATMQTVPGPGTLLPEVSLAALEKMAIEQALQRSNGRQMKAAEILGIEYQTFKRKLNKFTTKK